MKVGSIPSMVNKILSSPHINERNAFFLLLAMHTAGVIGLSIPSSRELFQTLTPFNLLASAAIVLHFQKDKTSSYFVFIGVAALVGYAVEVIGVSTGQLFGNYQYGETLGIQVLDVPLVIGVNWVLLVYLSGCFASYFSKSVVVRALLGAAVMTMLDVLIEPVAVQFDFWQWEFGEIPMQNYLAWFIVAFILHLFFQKLGFQKNNLVAVRLLYIQALFFGALNLF